MKVVVNKSGKTTCDGCGRPRDRSEIHLRYSDVVIKNPRLCNACIGAMYMALENEKELNYYAEQHEIDFDSTYSVPMMGEEEDAYVPEYIEDDVDKIQAMEDNILYEQVMRDFSPLEQEMLELYLREHTVREIAFKVGSTKSTVHRSITSMIEAMKEKYEDQG